MLDATTKVQPGMLHGNILLFGNYDECLDIRYQLKKRIIQGQYCSFYLEPKENSTHFFSNLLDLQKVSNKKPTKCKIITNSPKLLQHLIKR